MNTQVIISGIKCDKRGCGFIDTSVEYKNYHLYINRPCPQCGSNLLTEKDMRQCERIIKTAHIMNKVNKVVRWFNPVFYLRLFGVIKTETDSITIEWNKEEKD